MKKVYAFILTMVLLPTMALAQWGGGTQGGATFKHRDAIATADNWKQTEPNSNRAEATELSGYNNVRVDYDVSGDGISIVSNVSCSNDSIWVSGDSLTVTRDTWKSYPIGGCKDYYVYLESVSSSDTVTVYLTPYNN